MVDDTTEREVAIPAVYILGKNGLVKLCRQCPVKKSHFFQAHDQKNPCPAGEGQCLGEHPSEHQQDCSTPTQPTSMVGLVKSFKRKGKSALAQKLLRFFMFLFVLHEFTSHLSILICLVYASCSAMK